MGKRFEIWESTGFFDSLAGLRKVTIKDTVTGNVAVGYGRTREEAEQRAWERLKEMQGPPPSERKR